MRLWRSDLKRNVLVRSDDSNNARCAAETIMKIAVDGGGYTQKKFGSMKESVES